ncbi:sugar ABC transporter permease [Bacillus sp. 03113]|uniref:ABC transporter permease n=1 Tax=Bacillus sp. 03113 TaxID=2578211 RepID=UPI0011420CC0|nr:ABC transporter permease subunit [Bacillus sp. 03113]
MNRQKKKKRSKWRRSIQKNYGLYLLILPVLLYFIVFKYIPMYGAQLAFKEFIAVKGIFGSPWVGFEHFERFFNSHYFWRLIKNTIGIGIYELVIGFPIPIILALFINELRNKKFKGFVQTITYAPHFLSVIVLVGMLYLFFSPTNGLINQLLILFGGKPIHFMTEPAWFKSIYVFSGIWQQMGWSSIIYLAALSTIDPQLHDAAKIDGASRFQRILHVNLPGILPTIIILLILQCGHTLGVGFEKVFLMQNQLNMEASDVIATHIYRAGILGAQYDYSTAIGLFESVINFCILLLVNFFAKRMSSSSIW